MTGRVAYSDPGLANGCPGPLRAVTPDVLFGVASALRNHPRAELRPEEEVDRVVDDDISLAARDAP
jgi:hypothetical protein